MFEKRTIWVGQGIVNRRWQSFIFLAIAVGLLVWGHFELGLLSLATAAFLVWEMVYNT
jgi:CHASE2 domain-containing sensor protein